MSLKAGRVGVAPDQVDLFGNIIADSSGYTKAETDNKFLSKTDAASTYASQTAVHNWQGYSKDVNKIVDEQPVKVGVITYYINVMLKMFVVRFTGNAQEIPATIEVDFADVLPENVRPAVEFDGFLRGSNNVISVYQDGKVKLIVSAAAAWLAGTVTGIINTGAN